MNSELIPPEYSNVSISPRIPMQAVEDRQLRKETEKYLKNSRSLSLLVFHLQSTILDAKPMRIIDFIVESFFSSENQRHLREIVSS